MRLTPRPRLPEGITPTGRAALVLGLLSLTVASVGGYDEFALVAWVIAGLFGISILFAALPARVEGHVDLTPAHTTAGTDSRAALVITNRRHLRLYRPLVLVGVHDARALQSRLAVRLGILGPGQTTRQTFHVPAPRRGVLTVGPARARRTDPFGFFARHIIWARAAELVVRPRIIEIESLGSGSMHDLEGTPSDVISMSDLSFHALREYVPGDDLRHVHWRSAARTQTLQVRQYHDTRRNHVLVLLDEDAHHYRDEEFELATELAASVAARARRDGAEVTLVSGARRISGTGEAALDALARVTPDPDAGLLATVRAARSLAGAVGQVVLVTGGLTAEEVTEQVAADLRGPSRLLVLRADQVGPGDGDGSAGSGSSPVRLSRTTVDISVATLTELPPAIHAAALRVRR